MGRWEVGGGGTASYAPDVGRGEVGGGGGELRRMLSGGYTRSLVQRLEPGRQY